MQVCLNVPSIVYQNVLAGETAALSSVTLFTPSGPGLFRIIATIYAEANISSSVTVSGIVSGAGGDNPCNFDGNSNTGASTQFSTTGTSVFSGFSSVPFTLSTTVAGSLSSYDVYVTIEQLQ